MEKIKISSLLANMEDSVKEAMKIIDQGRLGMVFVVDDKKALFGLLTDGDIRRAILNGFDIEKSVKEIANYSPVVLKYPFDRKEFSALKKNRSIKKLIAVESSIKVPLIDKKGVIKDIMFLYKDKFSLLKSQKRKNLETNSIKKVLLIGGAGYLGSCLSRILLEKGYKVRVLDNLTYGEHGIKDLYKNDSFEFIKGDIRNISDIIKAVKGVDAVIHLAAIVGDPASQLDPENTIETNYLATKTIAEICKFNQVNKFLFASTCSVYGASRNPDKKLKETSKLNPVSLYAKTKLSSEQGILSMQDSNFSPTIFRFATLYGLSERMRFDLVVNLFTAKAVKEKKIEIFGGSQWRPNVEVGDAALACLKWLESPIDKTAGQIFNVGDNSQNYKIIDIGEIIRKSIKGTKIDIKKDNIDKRNYNISFNKIKKILGFTAQTSMKDSVAEMKRFLESKKGGAANSCKYDNYKFLSKKE